MEERVLTPEDYKKQVLLLFEREKIKKIQAFNFFDLESQLKSRENINITTLMTEVKSYLRSHPEFEAVNNRLIKRMEKVEELSTNYSGSLLKTEISPLEAYGVAVQIIEHIQNQIPLSLIRLGDGEGMFLEYPAEWQQFQAEDREFIQRLWWGDIRIDQNEWKKLQGDYLSALQTADILGIPEPYRLCRSFQPHLKEKKQEPNMRGVDTVIDTLANFKLDQVSNNNQAFSPTLTSCNIHYDLETWGFYKIIFDQFKDCSVISCHQEISQVLQERYGVTVQNFYEIPSEFKYAQLFDYDDQKHQPHYPDYFQRICSEITVSYPGEVFLVAAGFLGKMYCNLIKKLGGIALDVGSMVDYWLGYTTRILATAPSAIHYPSAFAEFFQNNYQIYQSMKNNNSNQLMTAQDYVKQATKLVKQDQFEVAIDAYKKAIEIDSDLPLKVYKGLGDALVQKGLVEEAIEWLNQGIKQYPNNPLGYSYLGNIFAQQNRCEDAIEQYRKSLELDSNPPAWSYQRLGNQLLKINQFEEAETVFKNLLATYPDQPGGYDGLARVALRAQQFELTQQRWERVLDLFPDYLPAWVGLGNILLEQGKLEQAKNVFEELSEKYPDQPQGYIGLVRVAKSSQQWELALERLDVTINLFADKLDLIVQKIDILKQLSLFEEAQEQLQQAKSRFPDEIDLDLAEAKLYQHQYNHQAAEKILDAALVKEPNNLKVQFEKADNDWLLGKTEAAQQILNQIRIQLDFSNLSMVARFTDLYTNVLLHENQIEQLQMFFDEARAHQVFNFFNRVMILSYHRFLMSQNRDQEASHFIDSFITEKYLNPQIYRTQIFLLFELEKIKQINALRQNQLNSKFQSQENLYLQRLIEKVKLQIQKYPEFARANNSLIETLDKINQLPEKYPSTFLNTYISPRENYKVACKVIEHIKNKTPLSLIRLGDAEGMFLAYEEEWPDFQEKDRETIQRIYWGSIKFDRNEWKKLKGNYESALQNADILGIPEPHRFCRDFRPELKRQPYNGELRGLITIIDTLLTPEFYEKSIQLQSSPPLLTSCHIHFNLEDWGLYQFIFNQIQDCSVISCHEGLSQALEEQYGVVVNQLYKIPSEYKYAQLFDYDDHKDKPHYPDYYEQLCSEITVSYPGEVFLVGAGLFGKIYCNLIKERGGIALDVGSMIDYWLNYNTRAYVKFIHPEDSKKLFAQFLKPDHKVSEIQPNELNKNTDQNQLMKAQDYAKQAITLKEQGKIQAAIDYYQKAIKLDPKQPLRIYKELGEVLVKQGFLEEGVEWLRTTIQRFPNKHSGYVALADTLVKQDVVEEAINNYQKAIEINQKIKPRIQKKLDKLQKKSRQLKRNKNQTDENIKNSVQEISTQAIHYISLAETLTQQGDLEAAIANYHQAIKIDPAQPLQIYQKLSQKLLEQKRFEEAEDVFHKLLQQYPDKPQGYIGLARVAMSSFQWEFAQQRWKKVLELFPETLPALVGLGNTLTELKQYEQAEKIFQELSENYPDKPQGYEGLAHVAQATYQWELAIKWWDVSIEQTQAKSSYLRKSRFLVNRANYEAGFHVIDTLITAQGEELETLRVKADLLISASRFQDAAHLLYQLKKQAPEHLPIHILLAQALIGANRLDEANLQVNQLSDSQTDPNGMIRLLKCWQKYYKAGISFDEPRIFGIGLSRTGTTSLTEALNILGYTAIHCFNPVTRRVIDLEDIFYFDAFTDSPISFRFEELYFLFPNAKFIYTERNLEDWVKSSSNLYKPVGFSTTKEMKAWLTQAENGKFNKFCHNYHLSYRSAYESLYANYLTWEDAYHAFEKRITQFFEDKPVEKLLRLNICAGEGWEKLCQFLDVPVPSEAFPYYNKEKANSRPAS